MASDKAAMARSMGAACSAATMIACISGETSGRFPFAKGSDVFASHNSVAACSNVAFSASAVAEDAAMDRAIDVLNDEMVAAGVRVFVGGLHPEQGKPGKESSE